MKQKSKVRYDEKERTEAMTCTSAKCAADLPDGSAYCNVCGKKQTMPGTTKSKRGNGDGSYTLRKDGVMMYQVTVDTGVRKVFYGKTKKECREKYEAYRDKENEKTVEKKYTVGEWADKWLETYKKDKIAYGSYHNYELYVKNHVKPAIGDILLEHIRPVHIAAFFADPKRIKLSDSAKNHINVALKGIFDTAVENNYCLSSPIKAAPTSERQEQKEVEVFTVSQVESIIKSAATHENAVYVLLPLYTGMRLGELLSLKWNDIDLANGLITVRSSSAQAEKGRAEKYPKSGKIRQVGISDNFEKALKAIPHKGIYVLCNDKGRPLSPSTYKRRYQTFFADTNNYYLSPHKCRHTYGTYLLKGGADLRNVQIALGHSTSRITEKYTHPDTDDVKNNIKKLGY